MHLLHRYGVVLLFDHVVRGNMTTVIFRDFFQFYYNSVGFYFCLEQWQLTADKRGKREDIPLIVRPDLQ